MRIHPETEPVQRSWPANDTARCAARAWLSFVALLVGLAGARAADHIDPEIASLLDGITNTAPRPAPSNTINEALRGTQSALATTNLLSHATGPTPEQERARAVGEWQQYLEIARRQRLARLFSDAAPTFISILRTNAPEELKRTALLELAIIAQEENNLLRAQQIFAHYVSKWPDDPAAPEVILRQGLILRQMGLNQLALTKFYAVMTSSLVLKSDKLEYYQRLVLQAQTEIAETYFQQGKFQDSAEFFSRVLKLDSPLLNKPQVHFKLIRSLNALGNFEEAAVQGFTFLSRYQEALEQAEVRFYLAMALKRLGRNNDAMQQVLLLLQDQQGSAPRHPAHWAYWQQRTGNEIANQLYKEGDYLRALEVYGGLAALSTNADWQLPVWYQMGLACERLEQPARAAAHYSRIAAREPELGTNATPGLRTLIDMARWRQQHLGWQTNTANAVREFTPPRLAAAPPPAAPAP